MERHFAFFRQGSGECVREWKGAIADPPPWVVRTGWRWLLNRWATHVSQPQRGEVALDVTHIGWPVGDFCYCTFNEVDRLLDWGPARHYIEVREDTLEIVANQESHRPIRSAVPGQLVIDITGTALEQHYGHIFGRFVRGQAGWYLEPLRGLIPVTTQLALSEVPINFHLPHKESANASR